MAGSVKNPIVKKKKPITPTRPRLRFATSSEARTSAEVPMLARPIPEKNLRAEYIQTLVEKVASKEERDIKRHEKKSMFLRPSDESASVANTSPPIKHPMKNEEAGRPVTMELSHSKPQSEMIEACVGSSHTHESLGRLHMFELVLEMQVESPLCSVQCQDGCASVKMVMNVCWPSKNQANETRTAMRNWVQFNSPIQFSIVEPREGSCSSSS